MAKKSKKTVSFDECTGAFPEVNRPPSLDEDWNKAVAKLSKSTGDFQHRILLTRSLGREALYHLSFTGSAGNQIHGTLAVPRGLKHRPTIIVLPDYLDSPPGSRPFTAAGLGHFSFDQPTSSPDGKRAEGQRPFTGPVMENFETSHLYHHFLDVVRTIQLVASMKVVDQERIGIMASGLSAGAAIFAASRIKSLVKILVLERPSTGWMDNWIQNSQSYYATEIRTYMEPLQPRSRSRVKKVLSHFDPLHFVDGIKIPVLMSVSMQDRMNPPLNGFSIFNRIDSEKYMDLYMEEKMDPDSIKKRKRALEFLANRFVGTPTSENIFN